MSQTTAENETVRAGNRLRFEKSPYLLQHAANPVDWYPWGSEAFEQARKTDKPIFLSIGYSTCHWCHVMAHESFEDVEVARLMNDAFVCVKVDREERPDVDNVYMAVCQMMTGGGGWPLTIIMAPDKRPFFAATYIPRENRFGRMGMMELVPRVREMWASRRDEVLQSAEKITATLRQTGVGGVGEEPDEESLALAFRQLSHRFDRQYGGQGDAPKFPTPHHLTFLLRHWKRTGSPEAIAMVETTLRQMRRGGIYDHLGFGFHRYATDRRWLVPHFEKMLYDQALLTIAYVEAYQATGKPEYADTAREILTYVTRDMTSPEGAFYSAEDADSEGVEGKFYVWTEREIREVLGKDEADLAVRVFNVGAEGNFSEEATGEATGANILHLTRPLSEWASDLSVSESSLRAQLGTVRETLFAHRAKRVHPHKDDKILTDWNGLMIAAFAKAAQALGEPAYADAAAKAADFVLGKMRTGQRRLLHRYRDGQAALQATVDDYAFLIWGLIELYGATFDVERLGSAIELNEDLIEHFWDDERGGLFFTASDGEELLVRQKEVYDGAVPSANSVAMLNLLRLGRMTANPSLDEKAAAIAKAFAGTVRQFPSAHTQFMVAVDFALGPVREIVVVGKPTAPDTLAMLNTIRGPFLPNKVVLLRPIGQGVAAIDRLARFTEGLTAIDGKATAYVCVDHACNLPTTRPDQMLKQMRGR